MGTEIQLFFFLGYFHWNSINNVLLRSVFNANESKSKSNILTLNHSLSTCTLVHDIDFGDEDGKGMLPRIPTTNVDDAYDSAVDGDRDGDDGSDCHDGDSDFGRDDFGDD